MVRSQIVLGEYARAELKLKQFLPVLTSRPDLSNFLTLQLKVFTQSQSKQNYQQLQDLLEGFEASQETPYHLIGDCHVMCGFVMSFERDYQRSFQHASRAVEAYCSGELPGPLSVALFNQWVCANHLNLRQTVLLISEHIQTLATTSPHRTVKLVAHRIAGNIALDGEDYETAIGAYLQAYGIAISEGRWRDAGSLACAMRFAQIRGELAPSILRSDFYELYLQRFERRHQLILREFERLEKDNFLNLETVLELIKSWEAQGVDGVNFVFLLCGAMEQLLRSEEYQGLLSLAPILAEKSRVTGQAVSLVDSRYYEAAGLAGLGKLGEAERVAQAYFSNAVERGTLCKQGRAKKLLERIVVASPGHETTSGSPLIVLLYKHQTSIKIDGRITNLSSQRTLFNFLWLLFSKKKVALDNLCQQLYALPYSIDKTDRRLHSLVERARVLLGDRTAIVRQDGMLSVGTHVNCRIVATKFSTEAVSSRRMKLVRHIEKSKKVSKVRELSEQFPEISKRTLQVDLKYLVAAGAIVEKGSARARHYLGVK